MKTYTEDKALLQAIRTGNYEAFEYLFKIHSARIKNIATRFISDKSLVDDVVQLVFLHLWEKRKHIPEVQSLETYLFVVVRNRCLNELRRINKEQSKTIPVSEIAEDNLTLNSAHNPECDLFFNELGDVVDNLLGNLPPRTREIFTLSRFFGLKNREIAEAEHISIKVVERHIQKALKVFNSHFSRMVM